MRLSCIVLLLTLGYYHFVHCACPRDEARAKQDDPTRECRKPCTNTTDCKGLKTCNCDDNCGYSCFNLNATCDDITANFTNGTANYRDGHRRYGARMRLSCVKGYHLIGEQSRVCRSNRKWSHGPYSCERSCPYPTRLGNAHLAESGDQVIYRPGDSIQYKCDTGYESKTGNGTRTCLDTYQWGTLMLNCKVLDCGPVLSIENGDYEPKNKTTVGTKITYYCYKGYRTYDEKTSWCYADGHWTLEQPPACERVSCPPPVISIENGKVTKSGNSWQYQDTITYQCNSGHIMGDGNFTQEGVCREDGTWGEVPACKPDLEATFDITKDPFDGYTKIGGATYQRTKDKWPISKRGFYLNGMGTLQSIQYPLPPLKKVCMELNYIASIREFSAHGYYDGVTRLLRTFSKSLSWATEKFWLVSASENHTEVFLHFVSDSIVSMDNIKVLSNDSCAEVPYPTATIRKTTPEPTTTRPESTTQGGKETTVRSTIPKSKNLHIIIPVILCMVFVLVVAAILVLYNFCCKNRAKKQPVSPTENSKPPRSEVTSNPIETTSFLETTKPPNSAATMETSKFNDATDSLIPSPTTETATTTV